MNDEIQRGILKELEMLRKLKLFELSKEHSQDILAEALGVSQSTISRMMPRKKIKGVKSERTD